MKAQAETMTESLTEILATTRPLYLQDTQQSLASQKIRRTVIHCFNGILSSTFERHFPVIANQLPQDRPQSNATPAPQPASPTPPDDSEESDSDMKISVLFERYLGFVLHSFFYSFIIQNHCNIHSFAAGNKGLSISKFSLYLPLISVLL